MQTRISFFALSLLLVPAFAQAAEKKAKATTPPVSSASAEAPKVETVALPAEEILDQSTGFWTRFKDNVWSPGTNVMAELRAEKGFDKSNKYAVTHRTDSAALELIKSGQKKELSEFFDLTAKQEVPLTELAYETGLQYIEKEQTKEIAALKAVTEMQLKDLRETSGQLQQVIKENKAFKSKVKRAGFARFPLNAKLNTANDSDDESYTPSYVYSKKALTNAPERDVTAIVTLVTDAPAEEAAIVLDTTGDSSSSSSSLSSANAASTSSGDTEMKSTGK